MDSKPTQTGSDDHMGITFNEIHSDEPHEAVKASTTEVAQQHTSAGSSHLSNRDDVFNVTKAFESGHIEAGTIVSDKKGSRPSLGQNILSALGEWWGKAKVTLNGSAEKIQAPLLKKEELVIPKAETRKEVVKVAATHATFAPKDDHKIVVQKIRTFKQDVDRIKNVPVVVKEQSEIKTGWKHTTVPLPPQTKKGDSENEPKEHTPFKSVPVPPPPSVPLPTIPKSSHSIPLPPPSPTHTTNEKRGPIPAPPAPLKKESTILTPHSNFFTQPITPKSTITTEPTGSGTFQKGTPSINVPDMVVKKEVPTAKKTIWVAPRVQPESSVLASRSTPAPVSQSYIPHKISTPEIPPTAPVVTITNSAPSTTSPEKPVSVLPKASEGAPVRPLFHSTAGSAQSVAPKGASAPEMQKQVPDVSQKPKSLFTSTTTPEFSVPTIKPFVSAKPPAPVPVVTSPPHDVAGITVLKEIPKVTPPPHTPIQNVAPVSEARPALSVPIPKLVPLPTLRTPSVETKPQVTLPVRDTVPQVATSEWESAKENKPSPQTMREPSRAAEIPQANQRPPQTMPTAKTMPVVPHTSVESFGRTSEPLQRSVETPRPVPPAPSETFERASFTPEPESFIPRTPPSPSFQRPLSVPPAPREASVAVSAPVQVYSSVPQNKALRTFVKWAILFGIVVLGVALALFASIYFNVFKDDTAPEPAPISVPTFIETSTQTPLVIEGTKDSFLRTLREHVSNSPQGLTQFYPTTKDGETIRPGTSEEILNFLNTHLNERTLRSLNKTLMLGSITTSKNEPFVVLQSTNFDILFTGLLAWEEYLLADFSPLFGENMPTQIKFKDAVRDNTSTRILYDDTGNEILLYSFINQNTVVITTSGEALSELIKKF